MYCMVWYGIVSNHNHRLTRALDATISRLKDKIREIEDKAEETINVRYGMVWYGMVWYGMVW